MLIFRDLSSQESYRALLILRELEEEANVLQTLHSKISDQLRRLQVEEMILKKHQEVFELNGATDIQELNNFISGFMTQYVTVKQEPTESQQPTTPSTPSVVPSISTTNHISFSSMLRENMQNYTGSMSQLLLGHDIRQEIFNSPQTYVQDDPIGVPTSRVPEFVQDTLVPGDLPAIEQSQNMATTQENTEDMDDDINVEETNPQVLELLRKHEEQRRRSSRRDEDDEEEEEED